MNVLVLTNMVPFVRGGAEVLCDYLVSHLRGAGVNAEAMRIPFSWEPAERLIEEMLACRSLKLANVDRAIVLKFPAYLVPWHNKVFWLVHQFRQAYDLWDAGQSNIPRNTRGEAIRDAVRQADNLAFAEAKAIYTVSQTVSDRLRHYNGYDSVPLPVALNDPELFTGGPSDQFILASGRINAAKRQHLLVRALRYAPGVRLVVAGPPDTPEDAETLRQAAEAAGVQDRVTLDLRFLPRQELADLVNRAAAVAYLPYDEDSVGYVTLEAFQAGKPVLTTGDSGGVLRAVRHNETGLVVDSAPEALAAALQALTDNPPAARRMGQAGQAVVSELGLTWPSIIERLMA
jgi:glycosyltransferase involved in cell wall biosynthesis